MPSTCEATVFYDDAGEASARIYALAAPTIDGRLLTVDELAACRLECRVEGPKCRYSTTLPTRVKLTHRGVTNWGDIPALIAETYLPDPCHWSPELPFLYRVIGEVRCGERVIAEIDQTFGIRPISVVRNRIKFQGKSWVPRAIDYERIVEVAPLSQWRETASTILIENPNQQLCAEADEMGVCIIASLYGTIEGLKREVARLGQFPSVAMILVRLAVTIDDSFKSLARNTLFAKYYIPEHEHHLRDGTHVCWQTILEKDPVKGRTELPRIPMLAIRHTWGVSSLEEARLKCDELQADIAGKCDAAGYIV